MTNNVGLKFSVGNTISQFTISVESRQLGLVTLSVVFSSCSHSLLWLKLLPHVNLSLDLHLSRTVATKSSESESLFTFPSFFFCGKPSGGNMSKGREAKLTLPICGVKSGPWDASK